MKGRKPKARAKIDTTRTRSDDPSAAEVRRTARALQQAAATGDPDEPAPAKDKHGRSVVGSARTGAAFLSVLRHCKAVTRAEEKLVREAAARGFGTADAAAFWTFQLLRLEKARKTKTIDEKAYFVALNQLSTSAGKLAEIAARNNDDDGLREVRFIFELAKTQAANTQEGRPDQPEPGPNGDPIEVE